MEAEGLGRIKIGFTDQPAVTRRQELQTGCPQPLKIVGLMPGDVSLEQALHACFAADRIQGEWFRPSQALLAYIAGNCPGWTPEFAELARWAPGLVSVWEVAAEYRNFDSDQLCANRYWHGFDVPADPDPNACMDEAHYQGIKEMLGELGCWASGDVRFDASAHELARQSIRAAMPACRNCGCV